MGLFGGPSSLKETQSTKVPGAKSRVFVLQENTEFLGVETNLHGKDLEVASLPSGAEMCVADRLHSASGDLAAAVPGARTQVL